MNLILCGLPGSGKTSVGRVLSDKLGRDFYDTDHLLENHYSMKEGQELSCREIAKKLQDSGFRALEAEILASLKDIQNGVIATGGGILTHAVSADLLRSMGCLIYLSASPYLLLDRILRNGMPTYLDPQNPLSSFEKLAEKRQPTYEACCQIVIDTDGKTPEQIASRVVIEGFAFAPHEPKIQ